MPIRRRDFSGTGGARGHQLTARAGGTFDATMTIEWWEEMTAPELAGTPIGELVDGLDEIGASAIPYGRLPRRARTLYSEDFSTWSDLAGATISCLMNRPKGGVATVRAVVAAARDAVATARSAPAGGISNAATAAQRLLDRLSERDRILLSTRVWGLRPVSTRVLARRLGVHVASVVRNQPEAQARFAELLADPAHQDVVALGERLHLRMGPLVRERAAKAALHDLGTDFSGEAGQMLLYVAGPYARRDTWLENTSTEGLSIASGALAAALSRWGAPSTAQLIGELAQVGIPSGAAVDFVESQQDLRCLGDRWVRWGVSAADKAEAILHLSEVPVSADDIATAIGQECRPRAVREALYVDDRFVRATRTTWALRQWGLDEYSGIFGEIGERIDAAGGTIGVDAVLRDMMSAFPDVAEASIRVYLGAPGFVIEEGIARRRTEADGWPPVPPLHAARGAFRNGPKEIRLAVTVTSEVLRGSGQSIHAAVGGALGVTPGQQRVFTGSGSGSGSDGDVSVTWRLSATNGPGLGSLRPLAVTVGADRGDTLVLAFDVRDASITVSRLGPGEEGRRRLQVLLGRFARDPVAAIARSLGCRPEDVAALLRWRGDTELIEIVEQIRRQ
jgi:hypothetical protein